MTINFLRENFSELYEPVIKTNKKKAVSAKNYSSEEDE